MENNYNYKVKIPAHWEWADLQSALNNGARFKVYLYVISLVLSFKLYSKAQLVENHNNDPFKGISFALISLIFGWWSIPFGPYNVYLSLKNIFKGGIDVTDDILLNLNEEAFNSSFIGGVFQLNYEKTNQFFSKMDKSDEKLCFKILRKHISEIEEVEAVAVGLFINTEEPFRCIGIETKENAKFSEEKFLELLYTKFYRRIYFEIIHLNNYEAKNEFVNQATFLTRENLEIEY